MARACSSARSRVVEITQCRCVSTWARRSSASSVNSTEVTRCVRTSSVRSRRSMDRRSMGSAGRSTTGQGSRSAFSWGIRTLSLTPGTRGSNTSAGATPVNREAGTRSSANSSNRSATSGSICAASASVNSRPITRAATRRSSALSCGWAVSWGNAQSRRKGHMAPSLPPEPRSRVSRSTARTTGAHRGGAPATACATPSIRRRQPGARRAPRERVRRPGTPNPRRPGA